MQNNIIRFAEKNLDDFLTEQLGQRYREYRNLWNSVDYQHFPGFPIHLDFELNDSCNQSCVMCPRNQDMHPQVAYPLGTKAVLDMAIFRKVIDEGCREGLMSINLGAFAEPLIHKQVFEMVKYARDNGVIDTRIITNGLLLHKHFDDVFDSGLVNLFVSVDAFTNETYQKIRGHGFEMVLRNVELLLEERMRRKALLPIVRVSFVDMQENSVEKEKFVEYWKDKVDFVDVQIYDNYNCSPTLQFDRSKPKKWDCKSPWARLSVLANGDILPCCNFYGRNIPVGNINTHTIKEAWQSKKLMDIRSGILGDDFDNCSVCQRI